MKLTLEILTISICLWLSYEDFRSREISVWAIVLLGISVIAMLFIEKSSRTKENIFFNLLFIGIQFLFLKMKVKRDKSKEAKSVFDHVGEGDWLVMLIFAFAFNYMNYLAFFVISIIAYLILGKINFIQKKTRVKSVPLAGILCTAFIIQLLLKYFSPATSLLANNIGF